MTLKKKVDSWCLPCPLTIHSLTIHSLTIHLLTFHSLTIAHSLPARYPSIARLMCNVHPVPTYSPLSAHPLGPPTAHPLPTHCSPGAYLWLTHCPLSPTVHPILQPIHWLSSAYLQSTRCQPTAHPVPVYSPPTAYPVTTHWPLFIIVNTVPLKHWLTFHLNWEYQTVP